MGQLNGWQTNAWVGIFNPTGTGTRYHHDDLRDSRSTPGTIGAMQGPSMATFDSTPPNAHIRRQLGTITPHSRYTVSLAIGVRSDSATTPASFDGYTIRMPDGKLLFLVAIWCVISVNVVSSNVVVIVVIFFLRCAAMCCRVKHNFFINYVSLN